MRPFFIRIGCIGAVILFWGGSLAAHEWKAPEKASKRGNPVPFSRMSRQKGKTIYSDNCAFCHGDNARGMVSEKTGLEKDTPDLTKRINSHSPGDIFWKIANGRGDMPAFKDVLTANDIWHVINYIQALKGEKK